MAVGYLLVALLAAAVAVFALQNGAPTTVRFFVWNLDGIPLAGLILGALVAGLVIAGVPLSIQRWRARSQARRLEAQVRTLEALRGIRLGATRGLRVTNLHARRGASRPLLQRARRRFAASLAERRHLRVAERRRLDKPPEHRLVEVPVRAAAAHKRERAIGPLGFPARGLFEIGLELLERLGTAAFGQQRLERALGLGLIEGQRAGVLTWLETDIQALRHLLAQVERAQRLAVHLGLVSAVHGQFELGLLAQHFGHALQLLVLRRPHDIAARLENDRLQTLGGRLAAEEPRQRPEQRRHDLGDHGGQRLPDHRPVAELRAIDVALHRQRDVDASLRITQNGDGEVERQACYTRGFHALTELELGEDDLVVADQGAVID